jgi:hypothetical protein
MVTSYVHSHQPFPRTYEIVRPKDKCKPQEVTLLMFEEIVAELRQGRHVVFASASKRILDCLQAYLKKVHADLWATKQFKFYSSDTPEKVLFHDIENINDEWKVDLVGFTSSISVGVDCSMEWFDVAFCYGSASSGQTGVDLIQQNFRVRILNDTRVRVFYSLAISELRPLGAEKIREEAMRKRLSLAEQFEQRQSKLYMERDAEFQKAVDEALETRALTKEEYQAMRMRYFWDLPGQPGLQAIPQPLQQLHEAHEDTLSHWAMYYAPMFEQTVRRMGHQYRVRNVNVQAALRGLDVHGIDLTTLVGDDDQGMSLYDRTPSVLECDYRELCQHQSRGNADANDVLKIKKFIFDRQCDTFPFGNDPDKRSTVFSRIIVNKSDERMHLHHAIEFENRDTMLLDIAAFRPYAEIVDKAKAAVGHIRRICRILGLANTFDKEPIVARGGITDRLSELNDECVKVIRIMRFRDRCKSDRDLCFDVVKTRVDNVLGNWTGTHMVDTVPDNKYDTETMRVCPKDTVNAGLARVWLADDA